LVPGRTLLVPGRTLLVPGRTLLVPGKTLSPESSTWNQNGFYMEPNRVLPGTKKVFSYGDSQRTLGTLMF
jgi:hypothetical protein